MKNTYLRKAFETSDNPYLPADILWSKRTIFLMGRLVTIGSN
jgi:hypothetical protein